MLSSDFHSSLDEEQLPFWATVCKTVRPILSDRCLSVLYVLSCPVCDAGVLSVTKRLDGSRCHLVRR